MAIPIKDITAGDTVSSMIDKINYNFDLINLAGGGPQGLQGLQGVRGYAGIQGIQGIQGIRGTGWYVPQSSDTEPLVGDLSLDGNSIQIWDGTQWVDTGETVSGDISPFEHNDSANTINEKSAYNNDPIVLGDNTNNGAINSTNRKSAIIIANVNYGGSTVYKHGILLYKDSSYGSDPAVITLNSGSTNDLLLQSKKTKVVGGDSDPAYIELENGNKVKLSPLVGIVSSTSDTTAPIVSADGHDGSVTKYPTDGWSWGMKDGSIIPNTTAFPSNSLGDNDNRVGKLYFDKKSEIVFNTETVPSNGEYLSVNHSNSGTVGNIVKISRYGVSVGVAKTTIADNFSTYQNGITVGGGAVGKPGVVAMLMPEKGSGSVTTEASSSDTNNSLGSPSFTLTLNTTSIDDYRFGDSAVITARKPSSSASIGNASSSLRIVGGTNTKKGGDLILEGGVGVGQTSNATGGDVYLSGGSNIGANVVSGNQVTGYIYNFGDVVIGINPNNHPFMRSGSNLSSTKRTNSDDNPNGVTFFDIGKFTAHGNKIILDSDSNNRLVNGYTAQQPKVVSLDSATLQFNGLDTVFSTVPFVIDVTQIAKYQMISGVMSFANLYYKNANTLVTMFGTSISDLKTKSEYTSSKNECMFSTVNTTWQKVGNIVNCQTKIDFYCSDQNGNLYAVTKSTTRLQSTPTAYKFIAKYGIITNVPLPVMLADNGSTVRSYYTTGDGYAFVECKNSYAVHGKVFDNTNLVVNNTVSRVNSVTQALSSTSYETFSHDANGQIYEQNFPPSTSYVPNDTLFNVYSAYGKLCNVTDCSYVIPEYLMTYLNQDSEIIYRKMQPADRMYGSMVLNFSYMLTSGFEASTHNDFSAVPQVGPNSGQEEQSEYVVPSTPDR